MPIRKHYKKSDGCFAFLGEFERSPERKDYKQRFYVDCRNSRGFSCNDTTTPENVTVTEAIQWLNNHGYTEFNAVYNEQK